MVSSQINMSKELKVMLVSFITNVVLSIIKIITGLIGKSTALIVDGIHSFSDLTTDIIAILGNYMAKKPADLKHPYGHGKSEYITSFIIGIIVVLLGLGVIKNISNGSASVPSLIVSIIIVLTILIKLWLAKYLINKGKQYENSILVASGKESSADVITSIIVLLSTVLSQLSSYHHIFKYTDKIAGIIVAIFIVNVGMNIIKDNISHIMGEQEDNKEYVDELKKLITDQDIVINEIVVLKYGPYSKLLAEIALDGTISLKEAHHKIDEIELKIKKYDDKILYINIHMCPK